MAAVQERGIRLNQSDGVKGADVSGRWMVQENVQGKGSTVME